jgi:hypothetical protein
VSDASTIDEGEVSDFRSIDAVEVGKEIGRMV